MAPLGLGLSITGATEGDSTAVFIEDYMWEVPTAGELATGDMNSDGILNILDVINIVSEILGTTFSQSVIWLEENFPQLNTKERLSKLNKEQYFSK